MFSVVMLLPTRVITVPGWALVALFVGSLVAAVVCFAAVQWILRSQSRRQAIVRAAVSGAVAASTTYAVIGNTCPDWVPDWICWALS